jgi:hypothetical protein
VIFSGVNNFVENTFHSEVGTALHQSNFVGTIFNEIIFMLSAILKKKLTENQVANIFVNGLFDAIDRGFGEVAQFINEDTAFVESPNIHENDSYEFALIVLVGNLSFIESAFDPEQADRIESCINGKLAKVYNLPLFEFEKVIKEYKTFISRLNHPSKNMIYGMSKGVFAKYHLNQYQDEYFRKMEAPNPLLLKRLDEVVQLFIWNWDGFFKKFRIAN